MVASEIELMELRQESPKPFYIIIWCQWWSVILSPTLSCSVYKFQHFKAEFQSAYKEWHLGTLPSLYLVSNAHLEKVIERNTYVIV